MRYMLLVVFALVLISGSFAQLGVSYQHSEVHPNIGVSYGTNNDWWGEFRLSADVDVYDFSPEILGMYNFIKKDGADFYGGVGLKLNLITGPLAVAGLNIYPFENKQFGFLLEMGYILDTERDVSVLRGLGGFRYTFNKS